MASAGHARATARASSRASRPRPWPRCATDTAIPVRYRGRFTGVKYAGSIAQGFLPARRRTVSTRFPDLPRRTRAWRWARAAPRSVTKDDQWPSPNCAVRAPAAAFCRAAMTATSSRVASRNRSGTRPPRMMGRYGPLRRRGPRRPASAAARRAVAVTGVDVLVVELALGEHRAAGMAAGHVGEVAGVVGHAGDAPDGVEEPGETANGRTDGQADGRTGTTASH